MCLGFSGGVFTTPAGAVRVSAPTPTGPRDDSVGEITVQALQEDWAPVGSPQRKDLQEFLDEVTSLAVTAAAGAGSAHTFSMAEGDSDADDDESDEELSADVVRRRKRKAVGNGSKNANVAKYPQAGGILSSLVPKDGSLTAMQTAAIMFGEARVRDMVAFEALNIRESIRDPILVASCASHCRCVLQLGMSEDHIALHHPMRTAMRMRADYDYD